MSGADRCWQALADAALFYLFSSTHVGSPASTSIFGLATWHDYHYYYGHVMWDIETFVVPVLTLLQPHTAESILDYRTRTLPNATTKRALAGPKRTTISLESAPSGGQVIPVHCRAPPLGTRITCPLMWRGPSRSIPT